MIKIILADGFEEVEAITVIDILRRANIRINIVSLSPSNDTIIKGGKGILVKGDESIESCDFKGVDMVIFPGGGRGVENLLKSSKVKEIIDFCAKEEKWLAAICAAPVLLAQCGLLKGKMATCYPSFKDQLIKGGARYADKDVICDERIITSKAAGTSHLFAKKIIEVIKDKNEGNKILEEMYYSY